MQRSRTDRKNKPTKKGAGCPAPVENRCRKDSGLRRAVETVGEDAVDRDRDDLAVVVAAARGGEIVEDHAAGFRVVGIAVRIGYADEVLPRAARQQDVVDLLGQAAEVERVGLRRIGSDDCFVHRDHLATVKLETDGAGAIGLQNRYTAYGEEIPVTATACSPEARGFIGERHDTGTGLIDLHARWYDPVFARYVTPDWFDPVDQQSALKGNAAGWLANQVGTNRYANEFGSSTCPAQASWHGWPGQARP